MKKIWYVALTLGLLFIGGSSLALADSISTNPNGPTTPQPFTVTCTPYTTPFVEGGAYSPDGSSCTYTVPQTGNLKLVGIYRGVVGNSVPVLRDFTTSNPVTTITDTGYQFNNPNPGDHFFAAAYSGASVSDLSLTDDYLQNSSMGTTSPDLTILNFVWAAPPPAQSPLTVTANNKTIELGSPLPTFTATLSGFVAPDTATSSDVTGAASCTSTATVSSTPGTYPIVCTVGTLVSAHNYTFNTFVPGTLTIVDTTKPAVTISSPINGHTYFKNDTVLAAATATDLSPIATTTYKFNGALINPSVPLSLASAPLGTSTLVVAATDAFGNTGYATSTFTIAPADLTPPSITITSPINQGLYAKTDSVFLTATITDLAPIASTVYLLNGVKINPALALPLSSAPLVNTASVVASDIYGNTATSSVTFFVVKSTNSCLIDILSIITQITQDKTLPNKPTILNLIADCSVLIKGLHHY